MFRHAPRRVPPSGRRKIVWLRAVPIFGGMMAALLLVQLYVSPQFPGNPIIGSGSIGVSLIFGIAGAFLISRFATVTPPPPPSKTQQRKLAATKRTGAADEMDEEEDESATPAAQPVRRRRRRR